MASAIRAGDHKLIKFYGAEGESHELYNLKNDIGETKDLASEKTDTRDALIAKLDAWLEETGAQIPTRE